MGNHRKHDGEKITADAPKTVDEVNAPTRMVAPYKDFSVEKPQVRVTPSAAQQAATLPRITDVDPVRGVLVHAEMTAGGFIVHLSNASASMHALVQLASSMNAEVEIVIRRRS